MKKTILSLALVASLSVALTSCSKSDSNNDPQPSSTPGASGSFSALVDGQKFTSTAMQNSLLAVTDYEQSRLDVRGSDGKNMIIVSVAEEGTDEAIHLGAYDFEDETNTALLTYMTLTSGGGSVSKHIVTEAHVTVTSCNTAKKTVSGTFSGKLFSTENSEDTLVITNGIFTDASYTFMKQ